MQLAARIIAWFVRIAGLIQIALGLLFWTVGGMLGVGVASQLRSGGGYNET